MHRRLFLCNWWKHWLVIITISFTGVPLWPGSPLDKVVLALVMYSLEFTVVCCWSVIAEGIRISSDHTNSVYRMACVEWRHSHSQSWHTFCSRGGVAAGSAEFQWECIVVLSSQKASAAGLDCRPLPSPSYRSCFFFFILYRLQYTHLSAQASHRVWKEFLDDHPQNVCVCWP